MKNKTHNKSKASLSALIIRRLAFLLFFMSIIIGYMLHSANESKITSLVNQKLDYIMETQSLNAREFLWTYQSEKLYKIPESIVNDPHILAVKIIDSSIGMPIEAASAGVEFPADQNHPYVLKKAIIHHTSDGERQILGAFEVYVDREGIAKEIWKTTATLSMCAIAAYVVILILIHVTISSKLQPVTYMAEQCQSIKIGKLLKRPKQMDGMEIKLLYDAFDKMQQNIGEYQSTLVMAKEEAERANNIKDEFLANMSHELRTPLNSILGLTNMIVESETADAESREMAGIVYKSSTNLLDIVNDILDISKIESGNIILEKIGFDIKENILNLTDSLASLASSKGILLECDFLEEDIPKVIGDPLRFNRILTNLIGNAIKYTEKGKVRLVFEGSKLTENSNMFELCCKISDTGIGIPESALDKIFDKFTQADLSTTRKYGGTGLGLSITKELIDLMGGEINIESQLGVGTTFLVKIRFPILCQPKAVESKNVSISAKCVPNQGEDVRCDVSTIRVLVAEDHLMNQIFIEKLLSKIGVKAFEIVENGQLAVETYKDKGGEYDIIFMDCHMPEKNGYEATADIRALEKNTKRHIPIIAMTADAMEGTREKCLEAGMDDYISKPAEKSLFIDTLYNWAYPGSKTSI